MNEAQKISDEIKRALPNVKCGTLRFWGAWFGRPHDNMHKILESECKSDILRLRFDGDERLTVWNPQGLKLDPHTFQIKHAERVLWEWFYYGRPKEEANLFFYDFTKTGPTIVASSNVNWFTPVLKTDLSLPAVEIL
jgi:hypothetical protein